MRDNTRGTLITGTDTGIGKTTVACAIIAALRNRGLSIGVYKPAETGCTYTKRILSGPDCRLLAAAGGDSQGADEVASYLFELPAAPLMAAEAAGKRIDPLVLVQEYEALQKRFGHVIVEGAGGLMVPLADGYTYLALARHLKLDVVVVVGSRLGCINHALLTFAAIQATGVRMRGYVVNTMLPEKDDPVSPESNRRTISRFTRYPDLGLFPYVDPRDVEDYDKLAAMAEGSLDLKSFL